MKEQNNQKEIGRVALSESQDLVISMVDNEKLDIRVWLKTETYTGPTKRGVRFFIFDGIWEEFKKVVKKVDKVYKELV